jgi:hypothetical protein
VDETISLGGTKKATVQSIKQSVKNKLCRKLGETDQDEEEILEIIQDKSKVHMKMSQSITPQKNVA